MMALSRHYYASWVFSARDNRALRLTHAHASQQQVIIIIIEIVHKVQN